MALTTLLMTIDFNGITVALPTIGRDLDTSTTGLQWTINAYLLALAAPSVAAGRLADIFGRRRVVLIGTVRLAIGPLVGGFLTETLSWRWFFFVNVPVALIAILLTVLAVRESRDETASRRVDVLGLVTVTAGLTALVLALQQSDTLGWGSPSVIGALIAAAIFLGVFFFVEPRLREPLIELGLFANRSYLGANGVAFAQNFGFGAMLFLLTLYLQNILGYSPLQAGLVFLAFSVVLAIVDSFAGRVGRRAAADGGRHGAVRPGVPDALFRRPRERARPGDCGLLVAGVGQALAYTVSTTGGMSAVPVAKAGIASGILSMVRLLGAVFGVATTGALFKAMENGRLAELLSASGANLDASDRAEIRGLLSGSAAAEQKLSQLAPAAAQEIERLARETFVHALDGAMLLCMFVSLAGVLASLLVAGKAAESPTPDRA